VTPLWQPTASLATLQLRAQLLATARRFFAARGVLEVDTPALVRHAVSDVQLQSAQVRLPGDPAALYLHTSPEYAMKRLLAAGSGDIYQLSHVFRGDERSRLHNAEFTLIEWYRRGMPLAALMEEVAQLARLLLGVSSETPTQLLSYRQAFERELGFDPLELPVEPLRAHARERGLEGGTAARCERDELLDWLMAAHIGPRLGGEGLCLLHRYPASQAALARLDADDPRVALRFELYYQGVELANGFEELTEASEQRARFDADQRERHRRGLPTAALDERLLAALAAGMPACSGVALGFDRLLMLRTGAREIAEVLPFALERA